MIATEVIDDILKEYYVENATQASIIDKFELKISSKIYEHFGTYRHEKKCTKCDATLTSDFASRTNGPYGALKTSEGFIVRIPECASCKHKDSDTCQCEPCAEIQERNWSIAVVGYVAKHEESAPTPANADSLSVRQLLSIFFHLHHHSKENRGGPKSTLPSKYQPQQSLSQITYAENRDALIRQNILKIDLASVEK